MDSMKSLAGIEEGKAGRSVGYVMRVRVLVMCCGIVLLILV